jgi:hypothetical protein
LIDPPLLPRRLCDRSKWFGLEAGEDYCFGVQSSVVRGE